MLLDSHVLIWWLEDSPDLSARVKSLIAGATEAPFFSPVSIYEIEWKAARGRLGPYLGPVIQLVTAEGFRELPLTAKHADLAARLPSVHKDPWDRLLAAQAMLAGVPLITCDAEIRSLGVPTFW